MRPWPGIRALLLLLFQLHETSSLLRSTPSTRWSVHSEGRSPQSAAWATVVLASNEFPHIASDLAERLSLPLFDPCSEKIRKGEDPSAIHAVTVVPTGPGAYAIGIGMLDHKRKLSMKPLVVDFCPPSSSRLGQRTMGDAGRPDLLSQAVAPKRHAVVCDLTAGLGQDALILAHAGAPRVHMVEQNPIVATLLLDAMRRLHTVAQSTADDTSESVVARRLAECLSVQEGNGVDVVQELRERRDEWTMPWPDVIYLDPMFPARKKRAAVKKNMQILHGLLDSQEASDESRLLQEEALLSAALSTATSRVVVKRPIHAPFLACSETNSQQHRPSFQVSGSVNRWDVYITK